MNPEMPNEMQDETNQGMGLTVMQTAQVVRTLHRALSSLFELFVAWSSDANENGDTEAGHFAVAVYLSTTGRHLGEHAVAFKALMPDSVLLADLTDLTVPSRQTEAAVESMREVSGAVLRLAVSQNVLLADLAKFCELLQQRGQPHADAPLLRAVEFLLLEIANDRHKGELLLASLTTPQSNRDHAAAVRKAEKRLISVGGLLPQDLPN